MTVFDRLVMLLSDNFLELKDYRSLFQMMVCHLIGTKQLSESMLAYCQLDSWERIKKNYIKIQIFSCK